jgi:PKD repeat protein
VGNTVTIRFVATRGIDFRGDMAIDDILVREPVAPTAEFSASTTTPAIGETIDLTDLSWDGPTSWLWTITGPGSVTYENATTNTDQDPQVSFGAVGLYTVELQATNAMGSDTEVKTGYIDVQSYYFNEDFETFLLGVVDGQNNWIGTPGLGTGYDWYANSGQTSSFDTGPASDHTTGTGLYAYTEASAPAILGEIARIETRTIDLSTATAPQLVFWYHMYGVDIDDLVVDVDGGSGWVTALTIAGQQQGDELDPWMQALVDLTSYAGGTVVLRWTGTRGVDFHGDMAIDDVMVREPVAPTADFTADQTLVDIGEIVSLIDLSYDGPTSWSWTITGPGSVTYENSTTSSDQNPQVSFGAEGFYDVQLQVANAEGNDTLLINSFIEVIDTLLFEDFEIWPAPGWTVINNGGLCVWESTLTTGRINYAGTGFAADADSDLCGTTSTMDTELRSPVIDLSSVSAASLGFLASYNDIGVGLDTFEVDVSDDGGFGWTNELYWDVDHAAFGPGESVVIDLTSYVGSANVLIRFHYIAPTWDWWAIVDDVLVY